jgi:hypothetical protein
MHGLGRSGSSASGHAFGQRRSRRHRQRCQRWQGIATTEARPPVPDLRCQRALKTDSKSTAAIDGTKTDRTDEADAAKRETNGARLPRDPP